LNTRNAQWTLPKLSEMFYPEDVDATELFQRIIRGFLGRMRMRREVHENFIRYYDSNLNKFYWLNKRTDTTTWKGSSWMIKMDVPLPPEDKMLYDATQKIKLLEAKLAEKEREIVVVRKKRYEELEPEIIVDRVHNASLLERSKNMDEWSIDEVCAFFQELRMDQYIPFLFSNRVDGNLFINLTEDDWVDVGITSKFHVRKLQLGLKAFRIRYERKRDKIVVDEDDELLSEYTPSELSAMVHAEDPDYVEEQIEEQSLVDEEDDYFSEEDDMFLTEEQRQEQKLDEENLLIEMIIPGDGKSFPMIGDIVRVKYVCTLVLTDKVVTSSKNGIQKKDVEFILGNDQCIKGFDRVIPKMSVGERSKVSMTSEYAYGTEGMFPHIPPNAEVKFDLYLLGFRPRSEWVKPLIQVPGFSQKPFFETEEFLKNSKGIQQVNEED
jgi:FK506-binding protein 1